MVICLIVSFYSPIFLHDPLDFDFLLYVCIRFSRVSLPSNWTKFVVHWYIHIYIYTYRPGAGDSSGNFNTFFSFTNSLINSESILSQRKLHWTQFSFFHIFSIVNIKFLQIVTKFQIKTLLKVNNFNDISKTETWLSRCFKCCVVESYWKRIYQIFI